MSLFFWRRQSESRSEETLRLLLRALDREFGRNTRKLRDLLDHSGSEQALLAVIKQVQRIREQVRELVDDSGRPEAVFSGALSEWTEAALSALQEQPQHEYEARLALARCINLLTSASHHLREHAEEPKSEPVRRKVVLPAELLLEAHFTVLPPERMLIGAGRTSGAESVLHSLFDVTGDHHACHVRADPERLARALITMERSGSFLVSWRHSHPGKGAGATRPSAIDHRQHADWIRDYSESLLSVILTADGHIRFWGTALEAGRIEVEVRGAGINPTEQENVYRIAL